MDTPKTPAEEIQELRKRIEELERRPVYWPVYVPTIPEPFHPAPFWQAPYPHYTTITYPASTTGYCHAQTTK